MEKSDKVSVISHESLCASYMRSRFFLPCAYRLEVNIVEFSAFVIQFPAILQTTNSWYITVSFNFVNFSMSFIFYFCGFTTTYADTTFYVVD